MTDKYILENGNTVQELDLMKWAKWFEKANRHISNTVVLDINISTVFLGIDHRFGAQGLPILFETMVFGGKHDRYQRRYTDVESAKTGHNEAVEMVRNSIMGKLLKIGNSVYGICSDCGSMVKINKPIIGSLHICS